MTKRKINRLIKEKDTHSCIISRTSNNNFELMSQRKQWSQK